MPVIGELAHECHCRIKMVQKDVARLNLAHGSFEDYGEVISTIRSLSKEMKKSGSKTVS
jgi:pyruvate kinase